jgi:hypothetical protein
MSTNSDNSQAQLVEIAKAVGAIVGVPLALFVLVNNIVEQPIIRVRRHQYDPEWWLVGGQHFGDT